MENTAANGKRALLKQYFGHDDFRPGQEELIDALLAGRDAMGVMPTGAGKSACYQLAALMTPGLALVISPLISLMKDQVASLSQAGIHAAYINSSLTAGQCREALRRAGNGAYKLMYVAPERLDAPDFRAFSRSVPISLVAVDEAHCVSQWGQDFRPSYLRIADFVEQLPHRPPVGAFTATATARVREDIEAGLKLRDPLRLTTGFDRPNLFFEVARPKAKFAYLSAFLEQRPGQSGIVYCATRKAVEEVCERLRTGGVAATRYHAGLADEERRKNQEDFVYDAQRVMVATNAFGMGIDKSNVSFVVHYNMPMDVESYYQEAGRAGRDSSPARCVLLYAAGDVQTAKFLIQRGGGNEALSPEERAQVAARDLARLDRMVTYCRTEDCLRKYLLNYFGERAPDHCGNCGSCQAERETRDATDAARKILSAVISVERKYAYSLGPTLIIRMLRGSRDKRVLQLGMNKLPGYGEMRGADRLQIREDMERLILAGYLVRTEGQYPVLRATERAEALLRDGTSFSYKIRKRGDLERSAAAAKGARTAPDRADGDLLSRLKALRMQLARAARVPAYIVFTDAALADMAAKQPANMREFMLVKGVGEAKARRYGEAFLSEIASWTENSGH